MEKLTFFPYAFHLGKTQAIISFSMWTNKKAPPWIWMMSNFVSLFFQMSMGTFMFIITYLVIFILSSSWQIGNELTSLWKSQMIKLVSPPHMKQIKKVACLLHQQQTITFSSKGSKIQHLVVLNSHNLSLLPCVFQVLRNSTLPRLLTSYQFVWCSR